MQGGIRIGGRDQQRFDLILHRLGQISADGRQFGLRSPDQPERDGFE